MRSPALIVPAGVSVTSTLTLHSRNGFREMIVLTARGSPSGATAALNPDRVNLPSDGAANSTLTFISNTPGTYNVTVDATSGSASQTITQTFNVVAKPTPPATTVSPDPVPPTTILGFPPNQLLIMAIIAAITASATVLAGSWPRRPRARG